MHVIIIIGMLTQNVKMRWCNNNASRCKGYTISSREDSTAFVSGALYCTCNNSNRSCSTFGVYQLLWYVMKDLVRSLLYIVVHTWRNNRTTMLHLSVPYVGRRQQNHFNSTKKVLQGSDN